MEIQKDSWPVLPIFELLRQLGDIEDADYRRTFNLGIGMIFIIGRQDVADASNLLKRMREKYFEIGKVIEAPKNGPRVTYA